MKKVLLILGISIVAIVVIGGVTMLVGKLLEENKPVTAKKEKEVKVQVVEVQRVEKGTVNLELASEGLVSARRETVLSAEVGGRIVEVHPRFEVGGEFVSGEIVLRIDDADYVAARAQAASAVADAKLALETEKARGQQAARDWKKIGRGGEPSEMVLRKPHIASAEARVVAAEASLEKAKRDLERTLVVAPFDCRVRRADLDVGAVVMPGTRMGEVYDVSGYEVRLPFSLEDYGYLKADSGVIFRASVGGEELEWAGQVVRREGDIDRESLSAYVVAMVEENKENPDGFRLPPPRMFVSATVEGKALEGVVSIPRTAVRGRDRVMVLNEEGRLRFRVIKILRSTEDEVVVSEGVEGGERVILTKLQLPVEGMELLAAGDVVEEEEEKEGEEE